VHWGRKQEGAARLKYKIVLRKQYPDIKIRECGLFVRTNTPFLGASPDVIIEYTDEKMKGVLEIKCLASDKWRSLSPDECCQDSDFYAEPNSTTGHLKLKHNHKYYHQVQGQLALTGLEWCDFVIWTLGGISVERIYFDADHWENLKSKLVYYYTKFMLPELFSRRVLRVA